MFSSNKSYSSTCSRAGVLHSTYSRCCYGRNFAIRMHFHPVIFYSQFSLVSPNLLHVWIPSSRCNYFDRHLFGNDYSSLLLPFGSWGLQLVVEKFHDVRLYCLLFFHLRSALLFLKGKSFSIQSVTSFSKLTLDKFASVILYFGYTSIMTLFVFLFTGSIGFFACYWFVRKIYGAVKVD